MLVVTRKAGESVHIGNEIIVAVERVSGDKVRLSIVAPQEVHILRNELVGKEAKPPQGGTGPC